MANKPVDLVNKWQQLIQPLFFGPRAVGPEAIEARFAGLQVFKETTAELCKLCKQHGVDYKPLIEAIAVEYDLVTGTYSGLSDDLGNKCWLAVNELRIELEPKGSSDNGARGRPKSKEVADRRNKVSELNEQGMKPGDIAAKLKVSVEVVKKDILRKS